MMQELSEMKKVQNKTNEPYPCLFSVSTDDIEGGKFIRKRKLENQKRNKRRRFSKRNKNIEKTKSNKRHIRNFTDYQLTPDQTKLLSSGLKFISTPVTKENQIRQQLLQDFNQFARRMRLRYIFHGKNKEQHPFHVKSNWVPPVQQSVALESYLEEFKTELAEIQLLKPKHNLPHNERRAIKDLRSNHDINIKKADKGTTTVIMSRHYKIKIKEGQIQLDDLDNYGPLEQPMVEETAKKAKQIISELYQRNHIDSMTKKWLLQTPNLPRI